MVCVQLLYDENQGHTQQVLKSGCHMAQYVICLDPKYNLNNRHNYGYLDKEKYLDLKGLKHPSQFL